MLSQHALTPKTLDVDFPWQCQSLGTLCICSPATSLGGEVQRLIALLMSHMQTNLKQKEYFHFNCINVNQWESAGLGLGLLLQKRFVSFKKNILCLNLGSCFSMSIIINLFIVSLRSLKFVLMFKGRLG